MSRFFTLALAVLLSAAASTAQATVLSSYLTFDGPIHFSDPPTQGGGEDALIDDSLSVFEDRTPGLAGFNNGDVVYGILTLSEVDSSGVLSAPVNSPNQIAIVFSAKINGTAPGGAINLDPIGNAADARDLRRLLAGTNAVPNINDNTVAVILSTSLADTAAEDPLNWAAADITTNFASPTGGWLWELTADKIPLTVDPLSDDFFHFRDLSATLGPNEGNDRAALTITRNAFGASWLPVDATDYANVRHLGDLTLFSGAVHPASVDAQGRGWTFSDDSALFVNPIPEPGSMAIFGLLGLAPLARRFRRK